MSRRIRSRTRLIGLCALWAITAATLPATEPSGWPLFRANLARTSEAPDLPNLTDAEAWQRPLLGDAKGLPPNLVRQEALEEQAAKAIVERLLARADPHRLPSFFPIAVDDCVYYRSYTDVRAVVLRPLTAPGPRETKHRYAAADRLWASLRLFGSLALETQQSNMGARLQHLVVAGAVRMEHLPWNNLATGLLSCDGENVYAVDESSMVELHGTALGLGRTKESRRFDRGNELLGFSISHRGKLVLQMGLGEQADTRSLYLGAPVPVRDRLLILHEQDDWLELLQLNPRDRTERAEPRITGSTRLLQLPAAQAAEQELRRRFQPPVLAASGDLVLCPTHAGKLIAVDLANRNVRWRHEYVPAADGAKPGAPIFWHASAPIVAGDRVVFTAPDSPLVHCVHLKDGKPGWTAKGPDLYLATVHDNRVVLVGKDGCRALALADGKEMWRVETGLPAGVGALWKQHYYLPLRRGADNAQPALAVIDVVAGKQVAAVAVPYPDALGNLLIHRGLLISQSATHIAAMPRPQIDKR
jgi:hypothetical protein